MKKIKGQIEYHWEGQHNLRREFERKNLAITSILTGVMFLVELVGGFMVNSLALLSDAGHMLTHLLALFISLLAVIFASKPPTAEKTFGFYRLEILAALFNGASSVLITAWIIYNAYINFFHPKPIASVEMGFIALAGLVVNIVCALILSRGGKGSLNVRSAFLHMWADTLSSVAVIAGAIVIYYSGIYTVDPILSVLICIGILIWSYRLVKESVDILLEAIPKGIDLGKVIECIKDIEDVKEVHDVHIWTITSGMYAMSAHIAIKDMPVSQTSTISLRINTAVDERFNIKHTVVQFESGNARPVKA